VLPLLLLLELPQAANAMASIKLATTATIAVDLTPMILICSLSS
jgi:hypothetical protein